MPMDDLGNKLVPEAKKRNIGAANIITGTRILLSIALLFCKAMSPVFYTLYIAAGISDMLDGAIARKTNTVSDFGSKLDTAADLIFVAVCLIKLLPVMSIQLWLYIWIAVIAMIKIFNIAMGFVRQRKFTAVHSFMNKLTGGLLFILPLTFTLINLRYTSVVVCTAATIAAIREGYIIRKNEKTE